MRFPSRIEAGDDCSMLAIPTYMRVPVQLARGRRPGSSGSINSGKCAILTMSATDSTLHVTAAARFIPGVVPAIISALKLGIGSSRLSCLDSSNELKVGVLDHAPDNVLSRITKLGAPVIVQHT